MKVLALGFWGTTDWVLEFIGRGAAVVLFGKASLNEDEAYAMMGGAAVGGIFGSIVGFVLSGQSRDIGAALGCIVGVCTGAMCGAIVQIVDVSIRTWLNSVNPK